MYQWITLQNKAGLIIGTATTRAGFVQGYAGPLQIGGSVADANSTGRVSPCCHRGHGLGVDTRTFAEKINLLAVSTEMRREMGEYNRDKVERLFRLDTMMQAYRDTFSEVLDSQ